MRKLLLSFILALLPTLTFALAQSEVPELSELQKARILILNLQQENAKLRYELATYEARLAEITLTAAGQQLQQDLDTAHPDYRFDPTKGVFTPREK